MLRSTIIEQPTARSDMAAGCIVKAASDSALKLVFHSWELDEASCNNGKAVRGNVKSGPVQEEANNAIENVA